MNRLNQRKWHRDWNVLLPVKTHWESFLIILLIDKWCRASHICSLFKPLLATWLMSHVHSLHFQPFLHNTPCRVSTRNFFFPAIYFQSKIDFFLFWFILFYYSSFMPVCFLMRVRKGMDLDWMGKTMFNKLNKLRKYKR